MVALRRSILLGCGLGLGVSIAVCPGEFATSTGSARAADPPAVPAGDPTPRPADVAPPQLLRTGDPHTHGLTDAGLDALREILRGAVADRVVPGVSLLLAHRGEVIFKEAVGNLTIDRPAQMASSAKPVTATVVMILVDQGKLALDDPIEQYLPEFQGITLRGKPPARLPTVRHVLSNTSGLPGDFLAASILGRLRNPASEIDDGGRAKAGGDATQEGRAPLQWLRNRSLAESVRALAKGGLASEPGAEFHYCTMGFNVAARVAEVAAARPFEELVRTELMEPLGMNATRYVPFGVGALRPGPTLPDGESRFILAGGGMNSTLDDFAAFYQMHLNGGTYRGRRILSERSAAEMHTRQGKLEFLMAGPYGNDYGLAFFLDRLDDRGQGRVISQPGYFGTTPWLDRDRQLLGVLFIQSNFLRVMPLIRRIQDKVRSVVPIRENGLAKPRPSFEEKADAS